MSSFKSNLYQPGKNSITLHITYQVEGNKNKEDIYRELPGLSRKRMLFFDKPQKIDHRAGIEKSHTSNSGTRL